MLRMFLAIALAAVAVHAQEAKLAVGGDAPQLSIAKWVKGDPVTFQKGQIYVVEFWATWCGPCIGSMPHLSELQETYKGKATFIGVTSEDPNNPLASVQKMVEAKGPCMGYTVAWDDGQKTSEAYMHASGQQGIPCSFVVDGNGKIAFIGHPLALDLVLTRLVAGTWDAKKGTAELETAFRRAGEIFQMDRSMALQALPAFEKDHPEIARAFTDEKFQLLLLAGKVEEATALGGRMYEKAVRFHDANGLNGIAWSIVDPEARVPRRDLDLAMKAAEKAVEFEKDDGAILDTLARVHYCKGDVTKAIELQTRAVECAKDDPEQVESLQATLDEYKSKVESKGQREEE